jgi:predicted HicB family RNase H-like nuclease
MNTMTCKGYFARVEYDEDDEVFTGRLLGIRDVVSFHAQTVAGLKEALADAVDDYLETCAKVGKTPEKAYSGNLMFRVPPEVHAGAALAAERSGKSLNQWAEEALAAAIGKSAPAEPKKKMIRVVGDSKRPKPQRGLKSSVVRERVGRR